MAEVMIRLKRMGTTKRPHNRIVVIPKAKARDSKTLEELGYYNPTKNPPIVHLDLERVSYWVGKGANLSPTVKRLVQIAKDQKK